MSRASDSGRSAKSCIKLISNKRAVYCDEVIVGEWNHFDIYVIYIFLFTVAVDVDVYHYYKTIFYNNYKFHTIILIQNLKVRSCKKFLNFNLYLTMSN